MVFHKNVKIFHKIPLIFAYNAYILLLSPIYLVGELLLLGDGVTGNELIVGEGRELLVNISLSNTGIISFIL